MAGNKRSDECLFCGSRSCYYRIHTYGHEYDELACPKHVADLERDADRRASRVPKAHVNSTRVQRRHRDRQRWRPKTRTEYAATMAEVPESKVKAYLFGIPTEDTTEAQAGRIAAALRDWNASVSRTAKWARRTVGEDVEVGA